MGMYHIRDGYNLPTPVLRASSDPSPAIWWNSKRLSRVYACAAYSCEGSVLVEEECDRRDRPLPHCWPEGEVPHACINQLIPWCTAGDSEWENWPTVQEVLELLQREDSNLSWWPQNIDLKNLTYCSRDTRQFRRLLAYSLFLHLNATH